jgi:chromosome segregation ATPase
MHENKLKENEKKQQESADKQAQLANDISAADTAFQDIEKKWRDEVTPLDAELSPLQDKMNQLGEQYRDLLSDMDIANTNIRLNGFDSNGNMINPRTSTFLQTLQTRCVEIQGKINQKKVEIAQLDKEMAPLVAKRKAVDQKWNKSRLVAGAEMKKLRRNLGRTARQASNKEGKSAAPVRFDPSLVDFLPIDFDFQRSYLLESFAAVQE